MQLEWKVSLSASCLHAAWGQLLGQRIANLDFFRHLEEPTARLQDQLPREPLARRDFLDHLLALAAEVENNQQLARQVLVKTAGLGAAGAIRVSELAAAIGGLETVVLREFPGLVDQLALRAEPLRQAWEARGPGLLHGIGILTQRELLVERAKVVLVEPISSGGGAAHLPYNSVTIEAVLAHPHDRLPETVRLGWLLAQLNHELPRFSDTVGSRTLPLLAQLAMLPPALEAAEEVELSRYDRDTLLLAFAAWHIRTADPRRLADQLESWWATYRAARPAWPVALAALAEMTVDLVLP